MSIEVLQEQRENASELVARCAAQVNDAFVLVRKINEEYEAAMANLVRAENLLMSIEGLLREADEVEL